MRNLTFGQGGLHGVVDCLARSALSQGIHRPRIPHPGQWGGPKICGSGREARRSALQGLALGSRRARFALNHETTVSNDNQEALRLLTLNETAQRLAICKRTLERLIASGEFPRPLRIGRAVRIVESDLLAFVETLKANAPSRP